MILSLVREAPRGWTADEIVEEYTRRGTPMEVADPTKAVFNALSRGNKKGWLTKIDRGVYAAPEHAKAVKESILGVEFLEDEEPPDDT